MSNPRRPVARRQPHPAEEDRLFREAMRGLAAVPDKDRELSGQPRPGSEQTAAPVIGARLDLHGCSATEALEQLHAFVVEASAAGLGRVLVITGQGRRSPDGVPVLRRVVTQWLGRQGARWVRTHARAPGRLGGAGALVLELRH